MRRPNLAADMRKKKKENLSVWVTKTQREANRVTNCRESQCLLVRNGLQIKGNKGSMLM